jgi:3-deoxy-D-manno-octulosonic-acid transferase
MYQIGFLFYITAFRIVAFFHKKAKKMVRGHRATWNILHDKIDSKKEWLWFHAASLGEFEQGRPIMEKIRASHPEYGILVTFYSPSGFEVRKNYTGADIVCYLPFDTLFNVKRFLDIVHPKMAFFIKYEFWPNYLTSLKNRSIPTYLISGIFRPSQLFFKNYAPFYRRILDSFTYLFVQNQESVDLLKSIGRTKNISISGDTRFDRVLDIRKNAKELGIAQSFLDQLKPSEKILVAGSTWPKDEVLLLPYFNDHKGLKMIIAPHEIHEDHLQFIESQLSRPSVRYSNALPGKMGQYDCLIIDCFGLLSSLYRYGDMAYIGGGFGAGIHNTLEAAVYGIPVVFGPNHAKFQEASLLKNSGGGFVIDSKDAIELLIDEWLTNPQTLKSAGKKAGEMVKEGSGATTDILQKIAF